MLLRLPISALLLLALTACQTKVVDNTAVVTVEEEEEKQQDKNEQTVNTRPTLESATLGGPYYTNDLVSVEYYGVEDADGEVVTFTHRWFVDGAEVSGQTGSSLAGTYFDKGQTVQVEVTPHDAVGAGKAVQSNTITIDNSPPAAPVVSMAPNDLTTAAGIWAVLDTPAADADGDAITYTYVWLLDGAPQPYGAATTFVAAANYAYRQRWRVEVTASDGGAASEAAAEKTIIFDRAAQIALGAYHSCLVTESGAAQCWGLNDNGLLGLGYVGGAFSEPQQPLGLGSGMIAIAAGYWHTCALSNAGGVYCWGQNSSGEVGNGASGSIVHTPFAVTTSALALATGRWHSCAVLQGGSVKCWGNNSNGQIGTGAAGGNVLSPAAVASLGVAAVGVAAGQSHTCVLTSAGGVKCWGDNSLAQIGNGSTAGPVLVPTDVTGLTSGVVSIAAGHNHTCAKLSSGEMRCWGYNADRQVQPASATAAFEVSVAVEGITGDVAALAAGFGQTCAVVGESARCWGRNFERQLLPTNALHPVTAPVLMAGISAGVKAIALGYQHSCAITLEGGVECWGNNERNQLGFEAIQVFEPRLIPGYETGVVSVALGVDFGCLVTNLGEAKCWGRNSSGATGNGATSGNTLAPTQVTNLAAGVSQVAAGNGHACAIVNGGVHCWGSNTYGQSGKGSAGGNELVPVAVAGLSSGVTAIDAYGQHTCALTDAGGVYCWGRNHQGQIGNGTLTQQPAPVEVTTGATAVAVGQNHSCAVVAGGSVYCWGYNANGELGIGAYGASVSTPSKVVADAIVFTKVALGSSHSCGITEAGGVKCWGAAFTVGNGMQTTAAITQPTDTTGLSSGVVSLAAAWSHSCALTSTGGAKCWGNGNSGVLGNGSNNAQYVPGDVNGMTSGLRQIEIGDQVACGVSTAGALRCWGSNEYYARIDGTLFFPPTPVIVNGY